MPADLTGTAVALIIDRYISWEIIRPFCTGLGLLILVFVGYSSARQLTLAAEGQLDMLTAFQLVGLNTLVTMEILMPSALFFSVLAAVGRLYRDAEMNALYAAGISQARILESVFKLSLLIAVITGIISVEGRPWAYRESYRLEALAAAKFDLKKMATGEFVTMQGSDYIFIADGIDLEQGLHKGVFLQKKHRDGTRTEIIVAQSASLPSLHPDRALSAEFYNGHNYLLDNRKQLDVSFSFKRLTIHLPPNAAQDQFRRKAETTENLSLSSSPKDIAEYQWRITTPLATILLALLAVPLARSAPREPRFRSFFIALGVYIAIFSIASVVRTWISQGNLSAFPGLWGAYAMSALLLLVLVRPPRWKRSA